MTKAESDWLELVASVGCVICRRLGHGYTPAQIHHIAEGSGLRSNYAVCPLCPEHHTGANGFHSLRKQFLVQYRVPGETEWGLLVWTIEDVQR